MSDLEIVDFDKAKELIKSNDKVVIEFFASWCQKCKMVAKTLADIKKKFPGVIIVKADGELEEVGEYFEIDHFPSIIGFSKGAKVGLTSKDDEDELTKFIEKL